MIEVSAQAIVGNTVDDRGEGILDALRRDAAIEIRRQEQDVTQAQAEHGTRQRDAVADGGEAAADADPLSWHAGLEQGFDGRNAFGDIEGRALAGGAEQHNAVDALAEELPGMGGELCGIHAAIRRERRRRRHPEPANCLRHSTTTHCCGSRVSH